MTDFVLLQALTPEEQAIQKVINGLAASYQAAVAVALIAVFSTIAVAIAWVVYEKWFTPQESKDLRKAFRSKMPLCVLGGDDGYADMKSAAVSGPEGILETQSKGRTGEHYTGALPRPVQFSEDDLKDDVDTGGGKDLAKTVAMANYISMLASRRLILRGARIPIWFAYRGKAVLTSMYGLVALQLLEGASKIKEFKEAFAPIDINAIKALFSEQWNESQMNAQEADKERKGELKARKFAGKDSLIIFFAFMILLVVVIIILLVVAYYFK